MISCFNEKELNPLYCLRGGKEARARAWHMLVLPLLSTVPAMVLPATFPTPYPATELILDPSEK